MPVPAGGDCPALLAGAGLAEAAALGAGRVTKGAAAFWTLGLGACGLGAGGTTFVTRDAAVLRAVVARFFFVALFFRPVARLGAAALFVSRRGVFVFFRAVERGLRRVVDFRRARVFGRAAMVDLPCAGRAA
jgi:hypothetical protein